MAASVAAKADPTPSAPPQGWTTSAPRHVSWQRHNGGEGTV